MANTNNTNTGEALFTLMNAVVGWDPTYYPPYTNAAGNRISARLAVPLYVNHAPTSTGAPAKSSYIQATLWGDKRAAAAAHWFYAGKTMTVVGRMKSRYVDYMDGAGNVVMCIARGGEKGDNGKVYAAGEKKPVRYLQYSFDIVDYYWGRDSLKERTSRPQGFEVPGTPGHAEWLARIAQTKALIAAGWQGTPKFGRATVGKVNGTAIKSETQTQLVAPEMANAGGLIVAPGALENIPEIPEGMQVVETNNMEVGYTMDMSGL